MTLYQSIFLDECCTEYGVIKTLLPDLAIKREKINQDSQQEAQHFSGSVASGGVQGRKKKKKMTVLLRLTELKA